MEIKSVKMTHLQNFTKFHLAVCQLGDLKFQNVDVVLSIIRAKKESKIYYDEFQEVQTKILLEDCKKDENGEPIIVNNQVTYETKEITDNVLKQMQELESKEIEMNLTPIKIAQLQSCSEGITANLIENLGEFIEY